MLVVRNILQYDTAIWNRPWIAVVGTWPDKGPAQLRFGKLSDDGLAVQVEGEAGDVVRWGQKAKAPAADGTFATQNQGWGIVGPLGNGECRIIEVTADEARAARRRVHPEDANAAPVAFGKGAKVAGKGKGRAKGLHAGQVAAIAAKAAGGTPTAPARPAPKPKPAALSPFDLAMLLMESVGGVAGDTVQAGALMHWAQQLAKAGTSPAPAPVLPVAPVAPVAPMAPMAGDRPAPAIQVDKDGMPLF